MATPLSVVDQVLDDLVAALRLGRSVLVQAAPQGHDDVLRYLLQRLVSTTDHNLAPAQPELINALAAALRGAAVEGHARCISAVLESCASLHISVDSLRNARNERGDTALIVAAGAGREACVKTLLQHKPEAQGAGRRGGHSPHGGCLRPQCGVPEAPPQYSARQQVEACNDDAWTALMWAAAAGHGDCVSQLLLYSPAPQVAAVNKKGNTALIFAAHYGHADCVSQLLLHSPGTQVAAANGNGDTALILAVREGHASVVDQLLRHNPQAQVAAVSSGGKNPLMIATLNNHPACVALLLAHSASSQVAAVHGGQHVVEMAARLGHPQCLDLLLAHDLQPQHLDAAWVAALRQWDPTGARTSHMQCLERLNAKGAMLLSSALEADKAKNRLFLKDFGSRALVADRVDEAIVGLPH